jgi:hypothetical protein
MLLLSIADQVLTHRRIWLRERKRGEFSRQKECRNGVAGIAYKAMKPRFSIVA